MLLKITLNDLSLIANIVMVIIVFLQWVTNKDLKHLNKTQSDQLAVSQTREKHAREQVEELRSMNQLLKDQLSFQQTSHVEKLLAKEEERKKDDRKRRKEIQPLFRGTVGGSPDQLNMKFFNEGQAAKDFKISTLSENLVFSVYDNKLLINEGEIMQVTGHSTKYGVNLKLLDFEVEITFMDIDGNMYKQIFRRSLGNASTSEPVLIQEAE